MQAQDASSPDGSAANAAQLCKRLKELVARLDSVLPYLNLAISTVALLNQGVHEFMLRVLWWPCGSPRLGAAIPHPGHLHSGAAQSTTHVLRYPLRLNCSLARINGRQASVRL